jgi:hypothetical protein
MYTQLFPFTFMGFVCALANAALWVKFPALLAAGWLTIRVEGSRQKVSALIAFTRGANGR